MRVFRRAATAAVATSAAFALVSAVAPSTALAMKVPDRESIVVNLELRAVDDLTDDIVDVPDVGIPSLDVLGPVIRCTASVGYPHNSSHVLGTVNSVGSITCDATMSSLYIEVNLYYVAAVVATGADGGPLRSSARTNAATACVPGAYYAEGYYSAVPPPGYRPTGASGRLRTPTRTITCVG